MIKTTSHAWNDIIIIFIDNPGFPTYVDHSLGPVRQRSTSPGRV